MNGTCRAATALAMHRCSRNQAGGNHATRTLAVDDRYPDPNHHPALAVLLLAIAKEAASSRLFSVQPEKLPSNCPAFPFVNPNNV